MTTTTTTTNDKLVELKQLLADNQEYRQNFAYSDDMGQID